MEPIISVIVCTYNQEATIARTLDSILRQQCHAAVEIVVGDDGSTDRTGIICDEYARKHPDEIRVFHRETNGGLIDNYFDCLLAAHGPYIADCAGDDEWIDDGKLEKELAIMEAHDDVTLVHTNWQYRLASSGEITPSGAQKFSSPMTNGREMLEDILTQTRRPVIHLCTAMYRKDIFMKAYEKDTFLFRNKEFGCEDLQLCFVMAQNGTIAYLPDVTLNYTLSDNSISNKNGEQQFLFVKRTTGLCFYLMEEYYRRTPRLDKFFKERLFAMLMHAFRAQSTEMLNETLHCEKEWGVGSTMKNRIAKGVMKSQAGWKAALAIRKIFVSTKQLFR